MSFRNKFGKAIFNQKYSNGLTWADKCKVLVKEVDKDNVLTKKEKIRMTRYMEEMKFIPGGRYLYYGGQPANFYNNCFCFRAEQDTREEWARLAHDGLSCLMCGGGIGIDYSVIRGANQVLKRTGGISSGPIPLMEGMNDFGRQVQQGGSRRSALYASLVHSHSDIQKFIHAKDWDRETIRKKASDFNHPAPLDMTNISVNIDEYCGPEVFRESILNMCETGEPGLSFNFGRQRNETLRNACGEFISEDDGDACNLGSINFSRIESLEELADVVDLGAKFLVLGGEAAELPTSKIRGVREKNRNIGLGLMGFHEWLLKRSYAYGVPSKMHEWLQVWKDSSESGANQISDKMGIERPDKYRSIAPTGTIGILAGTTTGIEPLFAVAYKRSFLVANRWHYEYMVDSTADIILNACNIKPENIETAMSLAKDVERRIKTQAEVQEYVDMGISSTINLPMWGTPYNNRMTAEKLVDTVQFYGRKLRGLTCYPDGARGGQPLEMVDYEEARDHIGVRYEVNENVCKGGVCGL